MKKNVFSILLVLVLTFCLALTGCSEQKTGIAVAEKDPLAYLQTAITSTSAALTPADTNLDKLISAMGEKGTVTAQVGPIEEIGGSATIAYNVKSKTASATLTLDIYGEQVSAELYASSSAFCLKVPEYLGDKAYGISFENFQENLAASDIWELLGVSYDEIKDQVEPVLDQIREALSADSTNSLTSQAQQMLENAKLVLKDITYTAAGREDNAVDITCTMTSEQMGRLIDTYLDGYLDMLADYEDMLGDISEELESIRTEMKNSLGDATATFTISNDTGLITALDILAEVYIDGEKQTVTAAVDMADLKNITVTLTYPEAEYDWDENWNLTYTYMPTSVVVNIQNLDAGNTVERKIALTVDEETVELVWTYDGTNFALTAGNSWYTVRISGKCSFDAKSLTLSDIVYDDDGDTVEIPLTLTLSTEANVAEMPEYTDILQMTEEDWMELIYSISGLY